jgi:hypothetical protein
VVLRPHVGTGKGEGPLEVNFPQLQPVCQARLPQCLSQNVGCVIAEVLEAIGEPPYRPGAARWGEMRSGKQLSTYNAKVPI